MPPLGQGDQLGVEQIGGDRVRQADRAGRHLDDLDLGQQAPQLGVEAGAIREGLLVREQDMLVGDRDDVVVEGAGGDRRFGLADEQGARRIEPVQPRDRAAGLAMLADGKGAAAPRRRRRSRRPARRATAPSRI